MDGIANIDRIGKEEYCLNIAETVSERSTCLTKHWGAIIVKDDVIVSTGFNGAPRKVEDCLQNGYCRLAEYRRKTNAGRGTCYEQCPSVHAEMNAIISANKNDMFGATLYLVGKQSTNLEGGFTYVTNPLPCSMCRKLIINARIEKVVIRLDKGVSKTYYTKDWQKIEDITGGY